MNDLIKFLLDKFIVIHIKSAPNHPQENGQVESMNKILCTPLNKSAREF